jgi:hypothetical protein
MDRKTRAGQYSFSALVGQLEHLAIALFHDGDSLKATPPWLQGNGLVVGNLSERTDGCGHSSAPGTVAYNSQYEAFWQGGNYLWSSSCAPTGLVDGNVYRFEIHASTGSWLWYQRHLGSTLQYSASAVHTNSFRQVSLDTSKGGIFFGVTEDFGGPDFLLNFTNVVVGWF